MRRRRWVLALFLIAGAAAYSASNGWQPADRRGGFGDLDTVLAREYRAGWSVAVPPKREGPYRVVPDSTVSASNPQAGLTTRIRDRDGTSEEITLAGSAEFDQMVVTLETRDGHRTLTALKRPK